MTNDWRMTNDQIPNEISEHIGHWTLRIGHCEVRMKLAG